jgi:hypothetical protein
MIGRTRSGICRRTLGVRRLRAQGEVDSRAQRNSRKAVDAARKVRKVLLAKRPIHLQTPVFDEDGAHRG